MSRCLRAALALTLLACESTLPLPTLDGITPMLVTEGELVTFEVTGTNFFLSYRARFDEGRVDVGEPFRAWVGDIELDGVQPVDETRLTGNLSTPLPVGTHDVRVLSPEGVELSLTGRVVVMAAPIVRCDADIDCITACFSGAQCVDRECVNGSADKDSDGDGLVDSQCAGGTDCDDDNPTCAFDCTDADGDDVCASSDCDDAMDTGASCSVGCVTAYQDLDGDAYGNTTVTRTACAAPLGYVLVDGDCADTPGVDPLCGGADGAACNPGVMEIPCDGVDQACNGVMDEGPDGDGDTFDVCGAIDGANPDGKPADCADDDFDINPGVPEGPIGDPTCSDGEDNDCDGDVDGADSLCSANLPPHAVATVSPGVGDTSTVFAFAASGSSDLEDALGDLTIEWDWDADGTFDASGELAMTTFGSNGVYPVILRVTDLGGAVDLTNINVFVTDSVDILIVPDVGTLAQAIDTANSTAGRQTVWVRPGHVETPTSTIGAHFDGAGVDVLGTGAAIDGSGISSGPCLVVNGTTNRYVGLAVYDCPDEGLEIFGSNNQVEGFTISGVDTGVQLGGSNNHFGPGNTVTSLGNVGLTIAGNNNTVSESFFSGAPNECIWVQNMGEFATLNTTVIKGCGIGVRVSNADGARMQHMVFHGDGVGVVLAMQASLVQILNSAFVDNGLAIEAESASFSQLDYNEYLGNVMGDCSMCATGPNSVSVDPMFVDAAGDDFRLRGGSLLIDAGTNLGLDLNGASPGQFEGANPDIGAFEKR